MSGAQNVGALEATPTATPTVTASPDLLHPLLGIFPGPPSGFPILVSLSVRPQRLQRSGDQKPSAARVRGPERSQETHGQWP